MVVYTSPSLAKEESSSKLLDILMSCISVSDNYLGGAKSFNSETKNGISKCLASTSLSLQ